MRGGREGRGEREKKGEGGEERREKGRRGGRRGGEEGGEKGRREGEGREGCMGRRINLYMHCTIITACTIYDILQLPSG